VFIDVLYSQLCEDLFNWINDTPDVAYSVEVDDIIIFSLTFLCSQSVT